MSPDPSRTSSYLLADVLEQIDANIKERTAGQLPPLDVKQHAEIVSMVESAMQTRERSYGGSDPLAKQLDQMPERHHYAAMGVASTLASHDGAAAPNPFRHYQLRRNYDNERAYLQHLAERTPQLGVTYQGRIVSADERFVVQSIGEGSNKLIQHDRAALNSPREELLKEGAKVEIRYLADRIAVVREWGTKQLEGPAARGLEMKGLGG